MSRTRTIGIIHPPLDVPAIVEKTAQFVAKNGPEFERMIIASNSGKPMFNFLTPSDRFHALYQHRVFIHKVQIETPPTSSKPSETWYPSSNKSEISNHEFRAPQSPPGLPINLPPLPPPPGLPINLPRLPPPPGFLVNLPTLPPPPGISINQPRFPQMLLRMPPVSPQMMSSLPPVPLPPRSHYPVSVSRGQHQKSLFNNMGLMGGVPLPEDPEPNRQRVDDVALVPEDQFVVRHPGLVRVLVSLPNTDEGNLKGQVVEISVPSLLETVESLKEKITGVVQLPSNNQKLSARSSFLKDNLTLASYNIAPGERLTLKECGVTKK